MPRPLPIKIRPREIQLRNGWKTSGLAKTGVARSLAPATLPQIQALRSSSLYGRQIANRYGLVDSRHMILRSSYMEISRRRVAVGINQLECVDERIRRCGFAAVSALELRLLRAIQSRLVQQRRAADHCDRLGATVPPNSEHYGHIAGNVCGPRNRRIHRRRQLSYNNFYTFSFDRNRILSKTTCHECGRQRRDQSKNRPQPGASPMANSILDKTPKPPSGATTR